VVVYLCPAPISVRTEKGGQGEWQLNAVEAQKASLDTGRSRVLMLTIAGLLCGLEWSIDFSFLSLSFPSKIARN